MWVAWLVLLAGCDLVFTFDKNPVDEVVPPRTVTLTYDRLSYASDVSIQPIDPDRLDVAALDGTPIPTQRIAEGTYTFTTDQATYEIAVSTTFGGTHLQFGGPVVHLRERTLGRATRMSVVPNTNIQLAVQTAPQQPGDSPEMVLHSTGLWAQAALAGPLTTYDWANATSLSGPLGLLDPALGDDLWVLQYGPYSDNLYVRRDLWGYLRATPTLVAGATTPVSGTLSPTTGPHCVTVTALRDAELDRIATVAPSTFSGLTADLAVSSIPHEDLHAGGGALLVGQVGTDDMVTYGIQFENPLPGKTIVSMGARRVRGYTAPGAQDPMELSYETRVFMPPIDRAGACSPQVMAADSVALIDGISINGRSIRTDDQSIALDDLEIEWSSTAAPADYYIASLLEVEAKKLPNMVTISTVPTLRLYITTTARRARIRKSQLVRNKRYYVLVLAQRGLPNASDGDFSTIAYPRATSAAVSGVFLVE